MFGENHNFFSKHHKIGEILLKRKVINRLQLKEALRIQKKERKHLGEILVKLGYAEEKDVVVALVIQCQFPYIAVDKYNIESEVINLIPKEICHKNHIIPLDRVGQVLSVVMADPLNNVITSELQKITQCRIVPFIATKCEIDTAIHREYAKEI